MTEPQTTGSSTVPVCYRHPGRETYVRCTRCNRPICPDCMNEASVGFQCPECVSVGRRTVRSAEGAFGGRFRGGDKGYVTIGLIAANVLVYILILAAGGLGAALGHGGSFLAGSTTNLEVKLGVFPAAIASGEYYRLVTAMFVHFSILHLAMNMYVLWVLGRYLERALGPARFAALYFVCGIGGNVACYLLTGNQLSGGASTAVFGLFAAMFFINRKLGLSSSSVVVLIVVNLIFTFLVPGISIVGHIGGLVTGAVAGLGLAYAPRGQRTLVQGVVLGGLLLIFVLLTVARTAQILGSA
ncbi:MAG TPA: rhomboid family intramembrane serine protease [Actinocatenispora sp.]